MNAKIAYRSGKGQDGSRSCKHTVRRKLVALKQALHLLQKASEEDATICAIEHLSGWKTVSTTQACDGIHMLQCG